MSALSDGQGMNAPTLFFRERNGGWTCDHGDWRYRIRFTYGMYRVVKVRAQYRKDPDVMPLGTYHDLAEAQEHCEVDAGQASRKGAK